jgi:hypothetical protein
MKKPCACGITKCLHLFPNLGGGVDECVLWLSFAPQKCVAISSRVLYINEFELISLKRFYRFLIVRVYVYIF